MTLKEIFTYGNKLKTWPDRIKFYSVLAMSTLVLGLGYGLFPFLYSKDFLVKQTKEDLTHFIQTNKVIEDSRFSFMKKVEDKKGCTFYTAKSKYLPYAITKVQCEGVKNE